MLEAAAIAFTTAWSGNNLEVPAERGVVVRVVDQNCTSLEDSIQMLLHSVSTGAAYIPSDVERTISNATRHVSLLAEALPEIDEELEATIDMLVESQYSAEPTSRIIKSI